jgi:hypothetical protein
MKIKHLKTTIIRLLLTITLITLIALGSRVALVIFVSLTAIAMELKNL